MHTPRKDPAHIQAQPGDATCAQMHQGVAHHVPRRGSTHPRMWPYKAPRWSLGSILRVHLSSKGHSKAYIYVYHVLLGHTYTLIGLF